MQPSNLTNTPTQMSSLSVVTSHGTPRTPGTPSTLFFTPPTSPFDQNAPSPAQSTGSPSLSNLPQSASTSVLVQEVESLMNELYDPNNTAARKREVEQYLLRLQESPDSLRNCFPWLQSGSSYAQWFSLSIYDRLLRSGWERLSVAERAPERHALFQYLVENYESLTAVVRNKLIKVVVDMARQDWPDDDAEFVINVTKLTQGESSAPLGMDMVRCLIEEMIVPPDGAPITAERRKRLQELLVPQLPQLLGLLCSITSGAMKGPNAQRICQFFLSSIDALLSQPSLVAKAFTEETTNIVFSLAFTEDESTALRALNCLSSMAVQTFVPADLQGFIRQCFEFLRMSLSSLRQANDMDQLELAERKRVTLEFTERVLGLYSSHIRRVSPDSINEILQQLYEFTVAETDPEIFFQCLDCWACFVDSPEVSEYRQGLVAFAVGLVSRILFSSSGDVLRDLDRKPGSAQDDDAGPATELDDDDFTITLDVSETNDRSQLDEYLDRCTRMVADVVAVLDDPEVFLTVLDQALIPAFEKHASTFVQLHTLDQSRHWETCVDMATLLSLTGSLSDGLRACFSTEKEQLAHTLVARGSTLIRYAVEVLSYGLSQDVCVRFERVLPEGYAALVACCGWLGQLFPSSPEDTRPLVLAIVQVAVSAVRGEFPSKTRCCALQLLSSLTSAVRAVDYMQTAIQNLNADVGASLEAKEAVLVYKILSHIVLYHAEKPKDTASRASGLREIFGREIQPLLVSSQQQQPSSDVTSTVRTLKILQHFVLSTRMEARDIKQAIFSSLEDVLQAVLSVMRINRNPKLVDECMMFFCVATYALPGQVGAGFLPQALSVSFQVFGELKADEAVGALCKFLQLAAIVARFPTPQFRQLIPDLTTFCLSTAYPMYKASECDDAALVLPRIYLFLRHALITHWYLFHTNTGAQSPTSPSARTGGVSAGIAAAAAAAAAGGTGSIEGKSAVEENQRLMQVLGVIGESFERTDITSFQYNLRTLQSLQQSRKLFVRPFFREAMSRPFAEALLVALARRTHDLLREEIVETLWEIVCVDLREFSGVCAQLVVRIENSSQEQQRGILSQLRLEGDLPSFQKDISNFLQEYWYVLAMVEQRDRGLGM
eukprot:Rmarinus@m.5386